MIPDDDFASLLDQVEEPPQADSPISPPVTPQEVDEDIAFLESNLQDKSLTEELQDLDLDEELETSRKLSQQAFPSRLIAVDESDGDDPYSYMSNTGLTIEREVPDITKPWMLQHEFVLVRTVDEVRAIVDAALENGRCSLDLETEGLDNRIVWDANGKPQTVHKVVGFCLAVGDAEKGYYVPVRHRPNDGGPDLNVKPVEAVEAEITRLCRAAQPTPKPGQTDPFGFKELETPPKVVIDFWNAKFDQEMLFPITGIDFWHPESFEDGQLAYYTLFSGDKQLGLKFKAEQILRTPAGQPYEMIELEELFPNGREIKFASLSPDEPGVIKYAGSDAICTRLLCARKDLLPVIYADTTSKYFTYRLEKQVTQVVRVMERNRVRVDKSKLEGLRDTHRVRFEEIKSKIISLAESKGFKNFEPGSPKQLGEFLFGERGLNINPKPPMNEKSQQYKTDYESLKAIRDALGVNTPEVLEWVDGYREEDKVLGTYLESLAVNPDENDELRFSFKQTGAATGRFSAPGGDAEDGFSGIPIHGIPSTSDLRTCFVARPGYLMVKCDYAGQELRVVSNLSNEPVWIKEFLEGDGDLHTITAAAFFNKPKEKVTKDERKMGKGANFSLVYGGGPAAIMRATGCDRMEGQRRKNSFDKAVPTFAHWVKGQHEKVKRDLGVWTAFGRWIAIPDANPKKGHKTQFGKPVLTDEEVNALRAASERHATNYPIQGSGADIMKISMVLLHKEFYRRGWLKEQTDGVRMLLTVHDELVFEIRLDLVLEAIPVICTEMERPTRMARPPYSPQWKVPLITDPLLGDSWGAEYGCHKAKPGETPPEGGFIAHGYVYKKVPAALLPYISNTPQEAASTQEVAPPPPTDPKPISQSTPAIEQPPSQMTSSESIKPTIKPADTKPLDTSTPVAVVRLRTMTVLSIAQVREAAARWLTREGGHYLKLVDGFGKVLIDPHLKIRINAVKFAEQLLEKNLSDGKVGEEPSR